MSGPFQKWGLSNCGAGRLCVANNCGILSVKENNRSTAHHTIPVLLKDLQATHVIMTAAMSVMSIIYSSNK